MLFTPHHCDMGRAGHLLQLNCMSWKYSPRFMMATQLEHSTIEGSEGGGGEAGGPTVREGRGRTRGAGTGERRERQREGRVGRREEEGKKEKRRPNPLV